MTGLLVRRSLVLGATMLLVVAFAVVAAEPQNPRPHPPKPQEVFSPYWTTEPGWHTEFQLRNNLAAETLVVTPILRLSNGQEYPLPPVSIAPSDVVTVDVNKEIEKIDRLSQTKTYGSVVFSFISPHSRNLYAAVMVHEMGQPIGYHLDVFPMDTGYAAGSREGIWWLPRAGVKDNLIIANGSDQSNRGRLVLYDSSGKSWQQDVQLLPKQTLRLVVREIVTRAGLTGTYGGLKFEVAERAGFIDTVHFVYDEASGFSAMMKMFDHDPAVPLEDHLWGGNKVWTIWAPMLALQSPDPSLAFPPGTELQPKVFVRNTTPQPQTVNVTLRWRGDSPSGLLTLPTQLKPFETQLIDVQALQQGQQIPGDAHWALVKITTAGKPFEIVAVASSYDESGRYGAQTPFDDQLADRSAAGQWQVDATHNSIIAVTNGGTKTVDALLTFHYGHGERHYEIVQSIEPGDQMWLNLGDIIRSGVPDRNGKPFPPDVTSGAYDIRQPNGVSNPSLTESKFILDKTNGHLAYGCQECCGLGWPWMELDPEHLPLQAQDDLSVWAEGSCDGQDYDITDSFHSWDTNNHYVATMNVQRVTGTGPGSTNASSTGQFNYNNGVSKYCTIKQKTVQNTTDVHALARFVVSVTSTPVSGESNSVLAGTAANMQVQAIDNFGGIFTGYRGTVHFSSTDGLATLPHDYTFTAGDAGTHTFSATLKTISVSSPTRDLTVKDNASSVQATQNIYVWWYVYVSVEFWKNCGFVQCPSFGSYVCQTAYLPGGYSVKTSFLALPYKDSVNLYNHSVTVRYGSGRSTSIVGDYGPARNQNYWDTGNAPPSPGGCLSDLLATNVGMANGCNPGPYGNGNIYWRFGN